jgi:transposase
MSQAYQTGVAENCRNAQVVFEKFHVIKNASEAVDKVRRAEVRMGGPGVWESFSTRVNGSGAKIRRT